MRRAGLALLLCLLALPAWGRPARVVSLNLCTDELVLRLADPGQVASVTWLSRDPEASNVAELAARVEVNHGLAEEIVAQEPDLVIAGLYTTRGTVALLREAGIPVLDLDVPATLEAVYAQIREVAAILGTEARGEALVAAMQGRLAALPPTGDGERPSAVVFNPNGFTVGAGSLVDELLALAGLRNLAAEQGLDRYGQLPLEVLVLAQPDVVVINADLAAAEPALAYEVLHHPVLERAALRSRVVTLPPRLWTCAGPAVIDAVERLREARKP